MTRHEPHVCPSCELEWLRGLVGLSPTPVRDVSAGWQKVSVVGRCNSCKENTGNVFTIQAGPMNIRLCRGCLNACGLRFGEK